MSQYVVTYFPDASLVVAAVGPFRSLIKAEGVRDRLEVALDPDPGAPTHESYAFKAPQVVPIWTEAEAVAEHGLESTDQGSER